MDWQDEIVSFYTNVRAKTGTVKPIGEILCMDNEAAVMPLRKLNYQGANYGQQLQALKYSLPLFALNELEKDRKTVVFALTGLIQLDFDKVPQHNIEVLKQAVFALPFICYCSLSCSGRGFYAIAMIAEPERQREYAVQFQNVFAAYGIPIDKTKGVNPNELRFVSYDKKPLIKDQVEPLRIKRFCTPLPGPKKAIITTDDITEDFKKVEHFANIIDEMEIDFAPTYFEYWNTALALANGLGEIGRDLFHRVCQHSPKYNSTAAERKYTEALKNGNGGITLATFFKYCNDHQLSAKADFLNVTI